MNHLVADFARKTQPAFAAMAVAAVAVLTLSSCGSGGDDPVATPETATVTTSPADDNTATTGPTVQPDIPTPPASPSSTAAADGPAECESRPHGVDLSSTPGEAPGTYQIEVELVGLGLPYGQLFQVLEDEQALIVDLRQGSTALGPGSTGARAVAVETRATGASVTIELADGAGPIQLGATVNAEREITVADDRGGCRTFYGFTIVTAEPITVG